jgi:steroid 5-alpha reductase family enzyme
LVARPVQTGLGFGGGVGGQIAALGMSYISPAFVTFLLTKVSGIPMSEKKYDKRFGDRKDYQDWKESTPKFFPKLW